MKVIIPSTKFKKKLKKLETKIVLAFKERITIFEIDEFSAVLNNHKLNGQYQDCRSINITNDFRLIYKKVADNSYLLVDIGSHSELYS